MAEVRVGIRELKSQFSHYVRQVKAGTTIIITERGKAVGRLSPLCPEPENRIRELCEVGLVAWNGRRLETIAPPSRTRGERTVSDLLLESRE
jgi:prevent-host-death family protein